MYGKCMVKESKGQVVFMPSKSRKMEIPHKHTVNKIANLSSKFFFFNMPLPLFSLLKPTYSSTFFCAETI